MNTIRTRQSRSIREFAEAEWDAVAGTELMLCHRWQRVMEESRPQYRPRYALIEDGRGPFAVAVTAADSLLVAPGGLRDRLAAALTLTFGAPFSAAASGIAVRAETSLPAALPRIEPALAKLCWRARRPLLGVTNVREADLSAFQARGFSVVRRPSTMVLNLSSRSYDEYLDHLSKDDRAELRRARRRGQEHSVEMRTAPLDATSGPLYPLFLEVCAHNGVPRGSVPIGETFFSVLAREMPDEAHIIAGTVGGELAGWALCLLHADRLVVPMIGLHYALSRPACLYALLIDEIVRFGLQHGVRRIHFGLGNERQKSRHGFKPQPRWACIRAQAWPLNFALTTAARFAAAPTI